MTFVKMLGMAIHEDALAGHIARRGPFMFHVTAADAVTAILEEGLRPGSERGISSKGGFFTTREDHVYLGDEMRLAVVEVAGPRAYLAVDLRKLDPRLIAPDEDAVQNSFDHGANGWVEEPPPRLPDGVDPEEAAAALATWAGTTKGFDAPAVAARSLDAGLIAYRGTIPPDAIKVIAVPSEGVAHFQNGAKAILGPDSDLAAVPELGFYKTEVARAIVLGRSLIRSAAESVGEKVEVLLPEWPQPEYALETESRLRAAARNRRRADDLIGSAVLHEASRVAHAISQLQPELGWRVTRDAFIGIAQSGTNLVRELHAQRGPEVALLAAQTAIDSVVATPGSQ